MSELRRDPLRGTWVTIAPDPGFRPRPLRQTSGDAASCPFCAGHESSTPPEIYAERPSGPPNSPNWRVRVVPSRTPALRVEGELSRSAEGLCDRMNGIGAHEVVIDAPEHGRELGDLEVDQVAASLWALRDRVSDLRRDVRLRACTVFRTAASASPLGHGHWQILATPFVPAPHAHELAASQAHFAAHERCLLCDLVVQEKQQAVRVVAENAEAIAIAPFAARVPFETWVLPLRHPSRFEDLDRAAVTGLAEVLRAALRKLDLALERAPVSISLHGAPLREGAPHHHLSLRIAPELGASSPGGVAVNPVSPEDAAAFLRKLGG